MADRIKIKESEILKGLNLGKPKTFEEVTEGMLFPIVKNWTETNLDKAREFLQKEGRSASNQTVANIDPSYHFTNDLITVRLTGPIHAKFLDKGVSGVERKRPTEYSFKTIRPNRKMAMSIKEWVRDKGIRLKGAGDYESLSYAIATNIKKKGIRETYFLTNTYDQESLSVLAAAVTKVLGTRYSAAFKYVTDGINSTQ